MDVVGQNEGRHEGAESEDHHLDRDRSEAVRVRARLEDVAGVISGDEHEANLMENEMLFVQQMD